MNIAALSAALAAVCPIIGVAIGDPSDKTTWRIDFDPASTPAQQQAAIAALAAYVVPAPVREATGKQLCAALSDLGLLAAWDTAVMGSTKPGGRYYWLHAYGDLVPENNPKIARLAKAANVAVAAPFAKALSEAAS